VSYQNTSVRHCFLLPLIYLNCFFRHHFIEVETVRRQSDGESTASYHREIQCELGTTLGEPGKYVDGGVQSLVVKERIQSVVNRILGNGEHVKPTVDHPNPTLDMVDKTLTRLNINHKANGDDFEMDSLTNVLNNIEMRHININSRANMFNYMRPSNFGSNANVFEKVRQADVNWQAQQNVINSDLHFGSCKPECYKRS